MVDYFELYLDRYLIFVEGYIWDYFLGYFNLYF